MPLPPRPKLGDRLPASRPSQETLELLALRRSTPNALITGPGPDAAQIKDLLVIGARISDHRRIVPFRFVVLAGAARVDFGERLAAIFADKNPEADLAAVENERQRFARIPVTIAVISAPDKNHKTPLWEQQLTAGAVCQNILIAANAMGFAAQWISEWIAYDREAAKCLGLGTEEKLAGFILLGSAKEPPKERPRVEAQEITQYWRE
jgi:nitroreductase